MKTAASGATNNMMNGPDTPVSVEAGSVRIQLLSDTLLRIEAKGQNGYEDRPSFTVPTRTGFSRIDYSLSEENGKAVIKTSSYTVYVPQNADDLSDVSVTDASGKELWRFSGLTKSSVFLPSPSDELKSWYFADNPRVIPSENGYSLPEGKSYEKNNGWEISYDAQDVFVFLPDGDYRTFTSDLVMLTGRSEMVSLDLLGYWDSRWYAYSEETALKQIADYKEKDIR